ncbi:MAG: hypothetical protein NTW04_03995 [Elusimicrobia bacterium]|nr:hypothetical protein [Elusimicrobiota bacterium]
MEKLNNYQKIRRNELKEELIKSEGKGGGCSLCGYKKSASALVFHHKDNRKKKFNISGNNLTKYGREELKTEAKKCKLVCANCHAEIHDKEGWVHENGRKTTKSPRKQ